MVLRQLWASHGAVGRGYQEADLIAAFASQAPDLAELLPRWLSSCEDPPLFGYLADMGLRLEPRLAASQELGCRLEPGGGGLVVQRVGRDGPAQRAGLVVGDELIALDGMRLRSIDDFMVHLRPKAPLIPHQLLFCRDGLVRSTVLLPTAPAVESWQLQLDASTADLGSVDLGTAEVCAERRRRWLGLEAA